MKIFTTDQLKFAGLLFIFTIAFRFGLSTLLTSMNFIIVWVIAVLYAICIMIVAWYFAKKDAESHPFYNVAFGFHLITYLVCNILAELWFLFDFQSIHERIITVHLTAIFWGFGLLIHFILFLYARKNSIKGIDKSEIFE